MNEDLRAALLERLRSSIRAAGISDREFGARVDASPSSVSSWFTLGRLPDAETLMRIPGALGLNGHWLLTGEGPRYLIRVDEEAEALVQRGREEVLAELEEFLAARREGVRQA